MAISDSLTIQKVINDDEAHLYQCAGSIDANATVALEVLNEVPARIHVILDFTKIERVNSMGLSLLLKIFEEWETNQVTIEVRNLNRMVNMLFKITGLGRFIDTGGSQGNTKGKKPASPQAPIHAQAKKITLGSAIASKVNDKNRKLDFVASLQTGQKLGWYLFNTYLQRKMQRAIHFEQTQAIKPDTKVDILFANAFESYSMMKNNGFVPVMRPIGEADEVVILAQVEDSRTLVEFKNANVVTSSEHSFIYLLGRFLCDENKLDSSTFNFSFSGYEIKALQMLIKKKADLLFMSKKNYENLSSFSKQKVRKVDESSTDFAFQLFTIAPNLTEETKALTSILNEMSSDTTGREVLIDMDFHGWCPIEEGELDMLKVVFDRYITET